MTIVGRDASWNVGTIIGRGASVLFGHFLPLMAVALVAASPSWLLGYGQRTLGLTPTARSWLVGQYWLVGWIAGSIIQTIVTVVLVYGTVQALRGRRISVVDCLVEGGKRLGRALVVGFLATIAIAAGLLLLVVPGILLNVMWVAAVPVATIERGGIIATLRRSAELTRGRRWRVFGVLLCLALVAIVAVAARTVAVVQIAQLLHNGATGLAVFGIANWVTTTLVQAYSACVLATLYYYLRREREGIDIDQIASVFD